MTDIAIGSKAWVFDENRREYTPNPPGRIFGGKLIYRSHWRETSVVGETRDSWIVGPSKVKVSKKTGEHKRSTTCKKVVFSLAAVDDDVWLNRHRAGLREAILRCEDVPALREIAALLGYKAEDNE